MRKWMIEFHRKFENRNIKIALVTRFLSANLSIYNYVFVLNLYGLGVRCDLGRFSVLSPFVEKSMVLCVYIYTIHVYYYICKQYIKKILVNTFNVDRLYR